MEIITTNPGERLVPFDIEKAKNGAELRTRDGQKISIQQSARVLCSDHPAGRQLVPVTMRLRFGD